MEEVERLKSENEKLKCHNEELLCRLKEVRYHDEQRLKMQAIKEAAEKLITILIREYDPHTTILVKSDGIEIVRGDMYIPLKAEKQLLFESQPKNKGNITLQLIVEEIAAAVEKTLQKPFVQ